MHRVPIVALTLATLLVVGAAAGADEAPQQPAVSQPAAPADGGQPIEPAGGCMPGGGCCGAGACAHTTDAQDHPATGAAADTGGCPCMKGKKPKQPM